MPTPTLLLQFLSQLIEYLFKGTRVLRTRKSIRLSQTALTIHGTNYKIRYPSNVIPLSPSLNILHHTPGTNIIFQVRSQVGGFAIRNTELFLTNSNQCIHERDIFSAFVHGIEDDRVAIRRGRLLVIGASLGIGNVGDELVRLEGVGPGDPIVKVGADATSVSFEAVRPSRGSPATNVVSFEFFAVRFCVGINDVWLSQKHMFYAWKNDGKHET